MNWLRRRGSVGVELALGVPSLLALGVHYLRVFEPRWFLVPGKLSLVEGVAVLVERAVRESTAVQHHEHQ